MRKLWIAIILLWCITPLYAEEFFLSNRFGTQFDMVPELPETGYCIGISVDSATQTTTEVLYFDGAILEKEVTTLTETGSLVDHFDKETLKKTQEFDNQGILMSITDYLDSGSTRHTVYNRLEAGETELSYYIDDEFQYSDTFFRDSSGVIQRRVRTYPDGTSSTLLIMSSNDTAGDSYTVEGNDSAYHVYQTGVDGYVDYQWFADGTYTGGRSSETVQENRVIQTADKNGNLQKEFFDTHGRLMRIELYEPQGALISFESFQYQDNEPLLLHKSVQTQDASYQYTYTYNDTQDLIKEQVYRSGALESETVYQGENVRIETTYLDTLVLMRFYQDDVLVMQNTQPRE